MPIALVFLPAADIPTFVGEGRVDIGITGRDQVAEHDAGVEALARERPDSRKLNGPHREQGCEQVLDLEFGSCKLQVQVPEKGDYVTPSDLIGKNIGTSFVHLAEDYFAALEKDAGVTSASQGDSPLKRDLKTNIIELSGSVEAACALGVADGIVDLVESGETMKAAGLKPIDTVIASSAILVKSKNPSSPEMVELIASRIKGVISKCHYRNVRMLLIQGSCPEIRAVSIQCRTKQPGSGYYHHPWQTCAYYQFIG